MSDGFTKAWRDLNMDRDNIIGKELKPAKFILSPNTAYYSFTKEQRDLFENLPWVEDIMGIAPLGIEGDGVIYNLISMLTLESEPRRDRGISINILRGNRVLITDFHWNLKSKKPRYCNLIIQ